MNINANEMQDFISVSGFNINIELYDCHFNYNFGGKSIVYINIPVMEDFNSILNSPNVSINLINSMFSNNKGKALHLIIPVFQLKGNILFVNNLATNGAVAYLEEIHTVLFDDNANVQFINNSAEQNGGAMYINLVTDHCDVFKDISNTFNVSFVDNLAGIAGNSIYISIPESCPMINNKSSLQYYLNKFKYFEPVHTINTPVVTSSYDIELYPPAIAMHNSSDHYLMQESIMLGEVIHINATVFDYFNNVTEPVTFSLSCKTCGDDYGLSTYQITVHDYSIRELKIFPLLPSDIVNNTNMSLTLLSALPPIYKRVNASLSVEISPCRVGYFLIVHKDNVSVIHILT